MLREKTWQMRFCFIRRWCGPEHKITVASKQQHWTNFKQISCSHADLFVLLLALRFWPMPFIRCIKTQMWFYVKTVPNILWILIKLDHMEAVMWETNTTIVLWLRMLMEFGYRLKKNSSPVRWEISWWLYLTFFDSTNSLLSFHITIGCQ